MAVNISTLSNNLPRVGRLSEDSSGRGEGYVPIAPPAAKDGSFWLWYTVNMTLATVCLVLNALLSTAMIVGREKTFKNSFYTIISLFAVTMVVSNICEIVCGIVVEGINMDAPGLNKASLLLDLIISYFSTILMFFLGLNRFAVFSSPSLNERLMNKKTLRYALSLSLLLSVAVSVVIFQLSSCKRVYESNVMVNYITNPIYMQVSNYVFYAIPLISSVFYLAVFNSLRHQRADAVSEKTKMLLDKAERCSLKQGTWILTGYLVRLLVMSRTVVPLQLNAL
ncbi:hypothetical protein RB195_002819 [Necator americanus]|uniref:7TM GPCR serpentine receptor class x (Srx) domain-containing protein n=1 Tax=Necator americanus TaxID=51031 RepID=A0ABR1DL83_NECAM